MIIFGSGSLEDSDLCGRTRAPLRYSSSLTSTSSPSTHTPSRRAWRERERCRRKNKNRGEELSRRRIEKARQFGVSTPTHPFANGRLPADNSRVDPGVRLDLRLVKDGASLQPRACKIETISSRNSIASHSPAPKRTIADGHARANNHVGPNLTPLANRGRGVLTEDKAEQAGQENCMSVSKSHLQSSRA